MKGLDSLWFSQAAISAWLSCPLKFKYRYVDGLYWPLTLGTEVSRHIEQGRRFHLLAQYYFSESEIPPTDSQLEQWLDRLREFLPGSPDHRFLPEYELRSARDGIRLLAKYDLLAVGEGSVTIYDWKTDGRAPGKTLATSPQTRLYLYLLSLTDYFVNNLQAMRMVYWNPRFPQEPLTIRYSAQQQEADGHWLRGVLAQIQETAAFPATSNEKNCRHCEYRPVCHGRGLEAVEEEELDWDEVNWDEIQEIALQGVNMP